MRGDLLAAAEVIEPLLPERLTDEQRSDAALLFADVIDCVRCLKAAWTTK